MWTIKRDKGLTEIINMWSSFIFKKEPSAELHIYGLKNKLDKKIIDRYKSIGIKFFGIVNKKILANKYSYSTAMIHPGYDETFCISALEAQASGLPILTFNRTALSERVVDGVNGYKVCSFQEMSKKVLELINNKSLHKKLSINSIKLSKKYSWEIIALSWYQYLKKLN